MCTCVGAGIAKFGVPKPDHGQRHDERKHNAQPQQEGLIADLQEAAIGAVAVIATALSLSDLAESIVQVANIASWKGYALAATIDANFISTEAFSLFCTAAIARETRWAVTSTKVVTLAMSGIANAYAMAHQAAGLIMQAACVAAGFAVPALVAMATSTLGKAVRG